MKLLTYALSAVTVLALAVAPAGAGVIPVAITLDDPSGVLSGHVDFTLDPPNGALGGLPGQLLGWGLTIDNQSNGWVVISSNTWDPLPPIGSIGDFSDLLTAQFDPSQMSLFVLWAVAPSQNWYTSSLASYRIDGSLANPLDTATGNIDLLFDVHSINPDPGSPGYDSSLDTVAGSQALLPATVTYTPEPATAALTALALLGLGVKARRRRW